MNYDVGLERRNTKNKKPNLKNYFEARSLLKNLKYKDFIKNRNYNDAMNLIMDLYAILGKKENPNLGVENINEPDQNLGVENINEPNQNLSRKKTRPSELPSKIESLPNLNKSIKKNYQLIKKLLSSGAYSEECIDEAVYLMPRLKILKKIYNESLMEENAEDSNDPNAIYFYNSTSDSKKFLKQALLEKKNVIPYYDVPFKGSFHSTFNSMSYERLNNEDIAKPPVFETFITTEKRNPRFPLLGFQHAYLGLRFTTLSKNYDGFIYERRHLKIGFGGGDKVGIFTRESGVDNSCRDSTVASQTSIPITKVPQLFSNIASYFNTYNYRLLSRNCNIFVKNMAKSIGLDHIAKIYSSISPAISGNRMVSAMVKDAKNGKFGEFYSGFESWKDRNLQRRPISSMDDRSPQSGPITLVPHNPNFPNLPWQYEILPKLALNRNMFLNEVLTEMCRDVGILKENQEFLTKNAIELEAYRPITNPFSSETMPPEKLQKNINARTDERYHYYKLKEIEDMIINSASTNYRRKQMQDVIKKINRVANQLDLVDILLRYKSNEYYDQVFKGNAQHISDIDKIQISIKLAMKACGKKYINAFLYLSKVSDMLEKAKFIYLHQEKYELVRSRERINRMFNNI